MSLTLTELNYLVWRYLQELGYDLAAFALDKHLECSKAIERDGNPLVKHVSPGSLVDLVQKGILYTMTDEEVTGNPKLLNVYGALINSPRDPDLPVKQEQVTEDPQVEKMEVEQPNIPHAAVVTPLLDFDPSVSFSWHPSLEIFAYGKQSSSAVIDVLNGGGTSVLELVTLSHPEGTILVVSWAPLGTTVVTGSQGELRAWSPDGKLKNVAPIVSDDEGGEVPVVNSAEWSELGQFLVVTDSSYQVSLWDALLAHIKSIRSSEDKLIPAVCWLSEHKFCVSTGNNHIKVYDITPTEVQAIGSFHGHDHTIVMVVLDSKTKLLASASDVDYVIKIWAPRQLQECVDLNIRGSATHLHTSPIIGLFWLEDARILSVLMEATINIWDTTNGTNVFLGLLRDPSYYSPQDMAIPSTAMVFNASLSPNLRFLAVADDFGLVSMWRVADGLVCVGRYIIDVPEEATGVGVCDLKWNNNLSVVGVSYLGRLSVLLPLPQEVN